MCSRCNFQRKLRPLRAVAINGGTRCEEGLVRVSLNIPIALRQLVMPRRRMGPLHPPQSYSVVSPPAWRLPWTRCLSSFSNPIPVHHFITPPHTLPMKRGG